MSERPSNIAADATWPTRAASRARVPVVAGTGGVRIIPSTVPIPAEHVETPEEFVGGRVTSPAPDTLDVRPPTRAEQEDEERRKRVAERRSGKK